MPENQQQAMAEVEQRWAQTQAIEQHLQRELIAFRTECHANSQPGSF